MPRFNKYSRGTTFLELARNKRADKVFELKHRIAKGPFLNFWSRDYLDEGASWADVYFLGNDRFTLWNALIMSGPNAYQDAKQTAAFNEVYDSLTPEEKEADRSYFVPSDRPGFSEMKFPKIKFDQFEGRTSFEQIRKREKEIEVEVYAHHQAHLDYQYGIGLTSVLDIPILDIAAIEHYVNTFPHPDISTLRSGKNFWTAETPIQNTTSGPVFMSNAIVL